MNDMDCRGSPVRKSAVISGIQQERTAIVTNSLPESSMKRYRQGLNSCRIIPATDQCRRWYSRSSASPPQKGSDVKKSSLISIAVAVRPQHCCCPAARLLPPAATPLPPAPASSFPTRRRRRAGSPVTVPLSRRRSPMPASSPTSRTPEATSPSTRRSPTSSSLRAVAS